MTEPTTPENPTPSGHEVPPTFASSAPRAQHVPQPAVPVEPQVDPASPANVVAPEASAAVPAGEAATAPAVPASPQAGSEPVNGAFVAPVGAPAVPTGAAFGHATTEPTVPLGATQPTLPLGADVLAPVTPLEPAQPKAQAPFGAGKVAAIIVAAALVGGAAGFGGSYLGSTLWEQPVSSSAEGPSTVTVNNPDDVTAATAVASKVLPSVVTLDVAGGTQGGSGSGVILSEDGYVLTNTHVVTLGGSVADPTIRVTTSDGHIYAATIVGTDPVYDLAVIKLTDAKNLTPIEFADSSKLNVGASAIAVGAPLGLSNSVTTGIISSLNRSIQIASSAAPDSGQQDNQQGDGSNPYQFDIPGMSQQAGSGESITVAVIQTDAAINPGNSGGALVDGSGELIGINVAIASASGGTEAGNIGVGFAIPSNIAKRVSDEIIESGSATHGLLGANVSDASHVEGAQVAGAYIVETPSGGAAAEAGLAKGDIVTEFNGVPITGASDLTAQVRAAAAGSKASLTYVRNGKTFELDVTLGELAL